MVQPIDPIKENRLEQTGPHCRIVILDEGIEGESITRDWSCSTIHFGGNVSKFKLFFQVMRDRLQWKSPVRESNTAQGWRHAPMENNHITDHVNASSFKYANPKIIYFLATPTTNQ